MKPSLWEKIFVIIFITTILAIMIVDILRTDFSSEIEVDPEYYSGILTVSGILFGFSVILVNINKPMHKLVYALFFISILTLAISGGAVIDVALGKENPIEVLTKLRITLLWNIITTSFLFTYGASWKKGASKNDK